MSGDVDEPDDILVEMPLSLGGAQLTEIHHAAGVVHPGSGPEQDGKSRLGRDGVSRLDHVLRLGGRGRLHHRQEAELRVVAVVLLVLGAVGRRVVGGQDEHAARHPGVGQGHHGVSSHIQTDVLHEHERPEAGGRRGCGHLHGDLLVRGEFEIHARVGRELLEEVPDLGGRSPGVGGCEVHAGLEQTSDDGLVAQEELLPLSS